MEVISFLDVFVIGIVLSSIFMSISTEDNQEEGLAVSLEDNQFHLGKCLTS